MLRIGPRADQVDLFADGVVGLVVGCGLVGEASVRAPKTSPVNSATAEEPMPPGVKLSTAWPNSWPTTSREEIQSPAWLWPIVTEEPFQ